MGWHFIIQLGLKNLTSRKSRSILTVGGVAIGIAAIIFLVSLGYGVQQMAIRETIQSKSLKIFDTSIGTGGISRIDSELITKIKGFNDVSNLFPRLETPAKMSLPDSDTRVDLIVLINDTTFLKQTDIALKSGQMFADDKPEAIITSAALGLIGIDEQKALGSEIVLNLLIRDGLRPEGSAEPKAINFKISGLIEDSENPFISVPIKAVTDGIGEISFSSAQVEVTNTENVAAIRKQVTDLGLQTDYIGDTVDSLNAIFNLVRVVLAGFGLIATFVAALGMFNTLSVSLMERTREIGIMKTLGTLRGDVWKLFLVEGMLISVIGGVVGIILGVAFGEGLNIIFNIIARATHNPAVDFYYSPPYFLAIIMGLVVVLGAIVGLIPARRATRISPLAALRYE